MQQARRWRARDEHRASAASASARSPEQVSSSLFSTRLLACALQPIIAEPMSLVKYFNGWGYENATAPLTEGMVIQNYLKACPELSRLLFVAEETKGPEVGSVLAASCTRLRAEGTCCTCRPCKLRRQSSRWCSSATCCWAALRRQGIAGSRCTSYLLHAPTGSSLSAGRQLQHFEGCLTPHGSWCVQQRACSCCCAAAQPALLRLQACSPHARQSIGRRSPRL